VRQPGSIFEAQQPDDIKTNTDLDDALVAELRSVRRDGVAMDREEFLSGVTCVAAAIRDRNGTVVGSIGASMPTMRADDEHLRVAKEQVISAARSLSAEPASRTRSILRLNPPARCRPDTARDDPAQQRRGF